MATMVLDDVSESGKFFLAPAEHPFGPHVEVSLQQGLHGRWVIWPFYGLGHDPLVIFQK